MNFRTKIEIPDVPFKIDYRATLLFMGSCFTKNIGLYMQRYKFKTDVNPFGVIFNPASVLRSLYLLMDGKPFNMYDLDVQNDVWFSYTHHSSFSSTDKTECLSKINERLQRSSQFLSHCDVMFITFGTAYAYILKKTGKVVGNCHKTPANEFDRVLLKPEDIYNDYHTVLTEILNKKPDLKIIFTVSPVRHLKDGAHGNQISKSCLLLAVDKIVKRFSQNCFYFPAYELLLDDLRDYRFYTDDMCHPSGKAISYIWEMFKNSYIDKNCKSVMREIDSITAACSHKAFIPRAQQHIEFQEKTIQKIKKLKEQFPFMDFTQEINNLSL